MQTEFNDSSIYVEFEVNTKIGVIRIKGSP